MFALGALALVCVACSQTEDVNTQDQWDLDEEHNIEPDQGVDMSTFDIPEDCQSDGILIIRNTQDVEALANLKCPELFGLGIRLVDDTKSIMSVGNLKKVEVLSFSDDTTRYEPIKYQNTALVDISGFSSLEYVGQIYISELRVDDLSAFNGLRFLGGIALIPDPKDPNRITFGCDEVIELVETLGERYTGGVTGTDCILPVQ